MKELIIELYEKVNKKEASTEVKHFINNILIENNLDERHKIPMWFTEFLEAILAQREVKRTFYKYDPAEGDISNFLAELENIIQADWNDYGESVEVNFPNLEMKICISTEGSFYEAFKTKSKR